MNDIVTAAGGVTDATHQPNPAEAQPPTTPTTPAPAPTEPQATPVPPASALQSDRPEWLPEKFKSPEDLAKSYTELEKKLSGGEHKEELRSSLIDEINASKLEGVPDGPDGYQVPEGFGTSETVDENLWRTTSEWAYERNLTQDDVNELVSFYANTFLPNLDQEFEKLGEHASNRAQALGSWVGANVPEAYRETIMGMATTAKNFEALEAMMKLTVPQALPGQTETTNPSTETLDDGKVQELMMSKEYMDPIHRNPAVVKQVDDFFKAKFNDT